MNTDAQHQRAKAQDWVHKFNTSQEPKKQGPPFPAGADLCLIKDDAWHALPQFQDTQWAIPPTHHHPGLGKGSGLCNKIKSPQTNSAPLSHP